MKKEIVILFSILFILPHAVFCKIDPQIMGKGIQTLANFRISSPDFKDSHAIPIKFTCDGQNIPPQLEWEGSARTIQEFAVIMEDPDAPGDQPFVHWVVYNIPSSTMKLSTDLGRLPLAADGTKQGKNSFGNIGYDGPCPPPKSKAHNYVITLYGLDKKLNLKAGATKEELLVAMKNQTTGIAQQVQLMGSYKRQK